MVKYESTFNDRTLELKDFYRSKGTAASIRVGTQPEILQLVDSKYYCDLFWALEQESIPYMITRQREEEAALISQVEEFKRKQEII